MGEYRNDRPSFRFLLEKNTELSSTDINIIKHVYEEANVTTVESSERLGYYQNKQRQQNLNQNSKNNKASSSSGFKMTSSDTTPHTKELEKLKEMGVMVFMPNDKNIMEGLTWDMLAGYEK